MEAVWGDFLRLRTSVSLAIGRELGEKGARIIGVMFRSPHFVLPPDTVARTLDPLPSFSFHLLPAPICPGVWRSALSCLLGAVRCGTVGGVEWSRKLAKNRALGGGVGWGECGEFSFLPQLASVRTADFAPQNWCVVIRSPFLFSSFTALFSLLYRHRLLLSLGSKFSQRGLGGSKVPSACARGSSL